MPESTSPPPAPTDNAPDTKREPVPHSMRSTVALVTAITGLVSAIVAFRHVPEEKTAKESYVVLQTAFNEQQDELDALRKDVLELRQSFAAYARAKEGSEAVAPKPATDAALPPVEVHVRPTPPASSASGSSHSTLVIIPSARPTVSQRPLPDVRDVEAKAHAK